VHKMLMKLMTLEHRTRQAALFQPGVNRTKLFSSLTKDFSILSLLG